MIAKPWSELTTRAFIEPSKVWKPLLVVEYLMEDTLYKSLNPSKAQHLQSVKSKEVSEIKSHWRVTPKKILQARSQFTQGIGATSAGLHHHLPWILLQTGIGKGHHNAIWKGNGQKQKKGVFQRVKSLWAKVVSGLFISHCQSPACTKRDEKRECKITEMCLHSSKQRSVKNFEPCLLTSFGQRTIITLGHSKIPKHA